MEGLFFEKTSTHTVQDVSQIYHPKLADEGQQGHPGAAAAKVAHGVGHHRAGLVAVRAGREVVQEVGEGRRDGAVVLGGNQHNAIGVSNERMYLKSSVQR